MFVIALGRDNATTWLSSVEPSRWAERDNAVRFETRGDARRAAAAVEISGDWSIETAGEAPVSAASRSLGSV